MRFKAFVMLVCLLMGSVVGGSAQSFLGKVLKGIEKTNEALDKADKFLNADSDLSGGASVMQTALTNEATEGNKSVESSNTSSSRHPLMDPLLNQAGGYTEVFPRLLCFVKHQPNDWAIWGLRGAVKSLKESYGNSQTATVYSFDAKGFLESIQQGNSQFQFISKLSNPMQRKMILFRNGEGEDQTPSAKELQGYVYDAQGRIVEQKSLDMHYSYNEQGLCSKMEYPEMAMDTYDWAVVNITRNEWGDVVNLKIEVTSYEELYDEASQKTVKGKQIEAATVKNYPIKYVYDAHNNWVSCESELGKVKRTITYY